MHDIVSPIRLTTISATAYFLLGAIGLILAVPPGYASPVFPAAGLALAYVLMFKNRALPGIWVGSFFLNLSHTWTNGQLRSATAIIAAVVATGATVQAWAGSRLVKRGLGAAWRVMEREQDAFFFLLLGGLLAAIVSSSVGTIVLYAAGIIEKSDFLFTWWNWYVGDAMGIFVFAPLSLCLFNWTIPLWKDRRRRILFPMLLTLLLIWLAFYGTARWENQILDAHFQDDGETIAKQIRDRLITHREVLSSLCHFIEAIPNFTFRQFELFTMITLKDNPDIFALSFNDLVTADKRPAFEQMMNELSPLLPFQITERNHQTGLVRAGDRLEYVAVRYIVPLANNEKAVGYDINSEPIRRAAIAQARTSNSMAVTAPIRLVQENKQRIGLLALLPVSTTPPGDEGTLTTRIDGFAVAVIKVDEMIDIAIRGHIPSGLIIQLTDIHAPDGIGLLYQSSSPEADTVITTQPAAWDTGLQMGDRDWRLSVYSTPSYLKQHQPRMAWVVGLAGLLFIALLQILMLGMTGRTAVILQKNSEIQELARTLELKVEERTASLNASMASLQQVTDRLILAVQAGGVGIWDYDVVHGTLVWDEQMFHLYGITPDRFEGTYQEWLMDIHPEDRKQFDEEIRLALSAEKELDTGFRVIRPDNTLRNIRALGLVQRDNMGRPLHIIGTNWDITAQIQAEENLRNANETLEQRIQKRTQELEVLHSQMVIQEKMASVGHLAAGIAHELNNPLNFVSLNFITLSEYFEGILEIFKTFHQLVTILEHTDFHSNIELIHDKEKELDIDFILNDIPNLFNESRRGFDRMAHIIQSMRDFSHVNRTGEFMKYNINNGIQDTLVIARNEYKYIADITTDFGNLPEIDCLPEQLNQVFLNLIVNSAQAIQSDNRSDRGLISIRTWDDETHVYCEFTDSGPGIPPDIQKKIFEPFFTTKPPGRGTGLGLSICYDIIVEKHGGDITVHCPQSGGTIFSICIPRNL